MGVAWICFRHKRWEQLRTHLQITRTKGRKSCYWHSPRSPILLLHSLQGNKLQKKSKGRCFVCHRSNHTYWKWHQAKLLHLGSQGLVLSDNTPQIMDQTFSQHPGSKTGYGLTALELWERDPGSYHHLLQDYAVGLLRSYIMNRICRDSKPKDLCSSAWTEKKNKIKSDYISAIPSWPAHYFTSTQNGYSIKLIRAGAWKSVVFKGIWEHAGPLNESLSNS